MFGSASMLFAVAFHHRSLVRLVYHAAGVRPRISASNWIRKYCLLLATALLSSAATFACAAESPRDNSAGIERPQLVETGAAYNSHQGRRHVEEFQRPNGSVDLSPNAGKAVDELYRDLMRETAPKRLSRS